MARQSRSGGTGRLSDDAGVKKEILSAAIVGPLLAYRAGRAVAQQSVPGDAAASRRRP